MDGGAFPSLNAHKIALFSLDFREKPHNHASTVDGTHIEKVKGDTKVTITDRG
jgi:hypothetical protein